MRVHELPYPVMVELHRMLDSTEKWKELAGKYLRWRQDDIGYLEYRERHGASPSREVFHQCCLEDLTVDLLFSYLSYMRFYRAIELLKYYVDNEDLLQLVAGEGSLQDTINQLLAGANEADKPAAALQQLLPGVMTSNSSNNIPQTPTHTAGHCGCGGA